MKKALALVGLLVGLASLAVGSLTAAPTARRFAPHQEPRGIGNLVARGDRVQLVYDAGIKSATGAVYVRNDLRRNFVRLPLAAEKGPSSTFRARLPARLLRGNKLIYYAVLRDPKHHRKARVPARGSSSAFILAQPTVVHLGSHRFGQTRSPDEVVARASASEVGWQLPPPGQGLSVGPQSFQLGADRSVYLHDSFNDRLMVWNAGDPDTIVRRVPLPERTADNDVALGPEGSFYVTTGVRRGADYHIALNRLSSTGETLWTRRLAGDFRGDGRAFSIATNSQLRRSPGGTMHLLAGMFGLPGGEPGWMPVAKPDGQPIPRAQQLRRTDWPYQPMGRNQRLVTEIYTAVPDSAPHEIRLAVVNRRGNVVHAWRVLSRTDINLHDMPGVVRGAPTIVLDATRRDGETFKWEYVVLRLTTDGSPMVFSVPHLVFGDNILPDLKMTSNLQGGLYQLRSDPSFGVQILRYSF